MVARISSFTALVVFATSAFALPGGGGYGGGGAAVAPVPVENIESSNSVSSVVNTPMENKCNYVGGSVCCNSLDYVQGAEQETLLSLLNVPIDFNALVGHGCSPLVGLDTTCNAQAACCEHTYEGIGVSCNNLAL